MSKAQSHPAENSPSGIRRYNEAIAQRNSECEKAWAMSQTPCDNCGELSPYLKAAKQTLKKVTTKKTCNRCGAVGKLHLGYSGSMKGWFCQHCYTGDVAKPYLDPDTHCQFCHEKLKENEKHICDKCCSTIAKQARRYEDENDD
jgi:hypothetical protein